MCRSSCKLCPNVVVSTAVTFTGGNLVIDIPATSYRNNQKVCLIVAQAIPAETTINAPVVITIGGDATTLYPIVKCDCAQATACSIRTRTRYPLRVSTSATGAVFKSLGGLSCAPNNALTSIPAIEAEATP